MNEYHINYYYKDNRRFAVVKARTPLQAIYFISRETGRWYLLKDYKAGKGYIDVRLNKGVEQTSLF